MYGYNWHFQNTRIDMGYKDTYEFLNTKHKYYKLSEWAFKKAIENMYLGNYQNARKLFEVSEKYFNCL
jgi:hypothetical protein